MKQKARKAVVKVRVPDTRTRSRVFMMDCDACEGRTAHETDSVASRIQKHKDVSNKPNSSLLLNLPEASNLVKASI